MASNLELRKVKAELMGVGHSKENIGIRIEELQLEIERLKEAIVAQEKKEDELKARVKDLENK